MKNFTVEIINSETYGVKKVVTVEAFNKSEAARIARQDYGHTIRGEYFPLHYSEIGTVRQIK